MSARRILRIIVVFTITWLILGFFWGGCGPRLEQSVDLDDCNNSLGDVACDFAMMNQDGNIERLYEHQGKIIILDFSAMWCAPCQYAALDVDEIVEKYGSENIVYITILIENQSGDDPNLKDLKSWSTNLGVYENPVLGANREWLNNSGYFLEAWPTFYIITSEMIVHEYQRGYSKQALENTVESLLNNE